MPKKKFSDLETWKGTRTSRRYWDTHLTQIKSKDGPAKREVMSPLSMFYGETHPIHSPGSILWARVNSNGGLKYHIEKKHSLYYPVHEWSSLSPVKSKETSQISGIEHMDVKWYVWWNLWSLSRWDGSKWLHVLVKTIQKMLRPYKSRKSIAVILQTAWRKRIMVAVLNCS